MERCTSGEGKDVSLETCSVLKYKFLGGFMKSSKRIASMPDQLVDDLRREGPVSHKLANLGLAQSKYATTFLPIGQPGDPEPRCASEVAVHKLREIMFPGDDWEKLGLRGGEW